MMSSRRSSTFELLASGGYDFGSALSRSPDRTCHFALLAWRRDPTVRLLVATTSASPPALSEPSSRPLRRVTR